MTRRELLAAGMLAVPALRARSRIDRSRLSAITDEIAKTTDEAIAFAHQYGLQFIEIRNEPAKRREYFQLPEADIKADAERLAKEGLKVSFVNTGLLKFGWPGSEPVRRRPEEPAAREKRLAAEQARWDRRMTDLQKAVRCAQIMGCDKVRVFTGSRVEDPKTMYSRIAETIGGEMAAVAEREKVYLLIENEDSQNIASSAEMVDIMKRIPSKWVGLNWDPHNAIRHEKVFPEGYSRLPRKRILNVQIKGKGIMPDSAEKQDWKAIMRTMDKGGYKGKFGLETHIFDGTLIAAAHVSMKEMVRIVGEF
jgi:sugar phosphate isomerase/epimerase